MNIFERASRAKLTFQTDRVGVITTDQLWDLPLTTPGNAIDLDKLAQITSREVESYGEKSFVKLTPDPRRATAELRLEILKHVIASKLADAEAAKKRAQNAGKREQILAALEEKERAELTGKSAEELRKELAELGET